MRQKKWTLDKTAVRSIASIAGLLFCLAFGVLSEAQGGSISGQVISPAGYPVANAQVRICPATSTGSPCTPLAPTLYADPALTVPVANPYTTDGFGNYSVFVPPALYYFVQINFTSDLQPFTYSYLVSAASNAVATAAPQYTIATYTQPGNMTTIGEGFVDPTNGQLRTDAAGGLHVPGTTTLFGPLVAQAISGTTVNITGQYQISGVQIAAANLLNGLTGTGQIVLATSPTLITPTLGVAAATSLTATGQVSAATLLASGTATANLVNSITGYQLNGTAPMNHILVGNGTNYVDATTVPSGALPTLFYQTVQANNTPLTQQPVLNFDATLNAVNGSGKSTVGLPNTGTAGTYTAPASLTTDAQGRVTSVTPGTVAAATIIAKAIGTSCALAVDSLSQPSCSATFSWGTTLSSAAYTPTCIFTYPTAGGAYPGGTFGPSAAEPTGFALLNGTITTTGFQYMMASHQSGAVGASFGMMCYAIL